MKRLFGILLALLLFLALPAPAYADIMWEPDGNRFYESHRGECEYNTRSYYANGPEGFVTLYDAPGGSMVEAQYENGELLWVGYTYRKEWALASRWQDGEETSGWIPLAELSLKYDYLSFAEEYADQIRPYNDEFANYDGDAEAVNFYEYPGAAEAVQSFDVSEMSQHMGDILENLTGTAENDSYISQVFTDEGGRTWGYVSYMYGHLNAWFCLDAPDLDAPDGTDFPVREVAAQELTPPQTPVLPTRSYVPYILVAAVAAATAGILVFFYGKRRKSDK